LVQLEQPAQLERQVFQELKDQLEFRVFKDQRVSVERLAPMVRRGCKGQQERKVFRVPKVQ
jgi:hypothetical protein